jgi:hypothetical protein
MFGICTVAFSIQIGSAACGIIAAITWWRASSVKTPTEMTHDQVKAVEGDIIPVLDRLMRGVTRQSKLNALAAGFAAAAAILQVANAFMPTCWG